MALQPCRECGTSISTEARTCPQCGARTGDVVTRAAVTLLKVIGWLFVLSLVLPLAYCAIVGGMVGKAVSESAKESSIEQHQPAAPSVSSAKCSTAKVEVRNVRMRVKDPCTTTSCAQLVITGEILHSCPAPTGVQLKVTARAKNGDVVAVSSPWPASVNNIAPNRPYAFDLTGNIDYDPSVDTIEIEPQRVKTWGE